MTKKNALQWPYPLKLKGHVMTQRKREAQIRDLHFGAKVQARK